MNGREPTRLRAPKVKSKKRSAPSSKLVTETETSAAKRSASTKSTSSRRSSRLAGISGDEQEDEDVQLDVAAMSDSSLESIIDSLMEKRGATKISALHKLIAMMQQSFAAEEIRTQHETVSAQLESIIRKGEATQVPLACHAMELLALTLGGREEGEQLYTHAQPLLASVAKNASAHVATRCAAVRCLSMLTAVAAQDDQETVQQLTTVYAVVNGQKILNQLVVAVFDAVSLLSSCLAPQRAATELTGRWAKELTLHLSRSDSVDVRAAVAMAAGVQYEAWTQIALKDKDSGSEGEDAKSPQERNGASTAETGDSAVVDALLDAIGDESVDASRHRAKSDRATQRLAFRQVVALIDSNEAPQEKITVGKVKRVVEGMALLSRLAALRASLQAGLGNHLQHNALLTDMLELGEDEEELHIGKADLDSTMTALEKKQIQREKSRVRKLAQFKHHKASRQRKAAEIEAQFAED